MFLVGKEMASLSWRNTPAAKAARGWFIAMGHNLLLMFEARLEREKGVLNGAEDRRREQRSGEAREKCRKDGSVMSSLLLEARGATQTSLKIIRWLRQCLRDHAA